MTTTESKRTGICGYDADNIMVRGKNLVTELMGKLSFTEMMLFQQTGSMPTPGQAAILDGVMVTIMEHGMVPSAMVTRLTYYGAPDSVQGAIAAGLLGVGDRFVGTASECAFLLEQVAGADDPGKAARQQVADYRSAGKHVPGFGHSIHKQRDPRVERLFEIVQDAETDGVYLEALSTLEQVVSEQLGKPLVTNVSAAIGAALCEAGVDARAVRGIIMTARCAGLTGHLLEEMKNPSAEALWRAGEGSIHYDP